MHKKTCHILGSLKSWLVSQNSTTVANSKPCRLAIHTQHQSMVSWYSFGMMISLLYFIVLLGGLSVVTTLS